jgi:hypothetical protein
MMIRLMAGASAFIAFRIRQSIQVVPCVGFPDRKEMWRYWRVSSLTKLGLAAESTDVWAHIVIIPL